MTKAFEIMVNQVVSVNKNDSVKTVLKAFVERRISGVPIINGKNEPVGFISDGDIMNNIGYQDPKIFIFDAFNSASWVDTETFEEKIKKLMDRNVMEIATKKVVTVDSNENIDQVAKILGNKKIKKVPVVSEQKLVGIISRGDIVRYVVKNHLDI
ncbi:CBS domain-containing protein [Desulfosporosinus sp. PR]|uniref:CBS domain-containing protein n=1 Tax=Candidatus Desulfosporosinus nitrosoreducens TaxID=3401928 RepID=UPI0027F72B0F|nr:CBS domain-containing protein [Desulfosporosinus sp. PR]MDQ7095655.1 CBS domain-containing protein [Desulfosporosinus sp. PR]